MIQKGINKMGGTENLVVAMGKSIGEKIESENKTLFLKTVVFVSVNNLIIGTLFFVLK